MYKTRFVFRIFLLLFLFGATYANAQTITTVAGNHSVGYSGDGGNATAAALNNPIAITASSSGIIYFADLANNRIRKITPSGIISTVAGNGATGSAGDGGPATAASVDNPIGLAVDNSGNIYIADYNNAKIRKVSTSGIITTVAGTGTISYSSDGTAATAARIAKPTGVAVDASGNVYFSEQNNHIVRKINSSGYLTTFAGIISPGYSGDGGPATLAAISYPYALMFDASGNLFILDNGNNRVRKVNTSGIISTVAGNGGVGFSGDGGAATAAAFNNISGVVYDASGNLFIADQNNHRIRKVTASGIISTYAGTGAVGYAGDGGAATTCTFYKPSAVAVYAGAVYVTDMGNSAIRKIAINHAPSFNGGAIQTLGMCTSASATAINTLMAITDTDASQSETWSVTQSPVHGSLAGFPLTVSSTGGVITPSGLTYTPTTGYSGTDSFKIQVSDGALSAITTVRITTATTPTAGSISGASSLCPGTTITLTNAVSGGTWSSSAPSIASVGATGVVTGVTSGSATISYTVSNSCGTVVATKSDTVKPLLVAGGIIGATTQCTGSNITLTATISGGTWSSSNAAIATVTTAGIVTGVSAGAAVISYTVGNSCGSSSAFKADTIIATPTAGVIAGASSVCAGASITLTDAVSGGTWSSSNASIASVSSSGVVSGIAAGNTTISYSVSNVCGTAVATNRDTVKALAVAGVISGTGSQCIGTNITLTTTGSGGTWSSANPSIASVSAAGVVRGVSAGNTTISYTVINGCGTTIAAKSDTVKPFPVSGSISGATAECVGSTITLTTTGTAGGTWSTTNNAIATATAAGVIAGVSVGVVTVSYTVTNSCGSSSAFRTDTVLAAPAAITIAGAGSLCVGNSITLTTTGSGGTWSSANAAIASVSTTGVVRGLSAGITTISYSVAGRCGTLVAAKADTVKAFPVAGSVSGPYFQCTSSNITMTTTASGGTWSTSNASIATASNTGVLTGIAVGAVVVSYTVVNSCGSSSAFHPDTVLLAPLAGVITGVTSLCTGNTIYLDDTVKGGTWSSSNSAIASINTVGGVFGVATGNAIISYSISNRCGTAVATKPDTVRTFPAAGVINGSNVQCAGSNITLTATGSGGTWSTSNMAIATATAAGVIRGVSAGVVVVSYTVNNSCGSSSAFKTDTVKVSPSVAGIAGASSVAISTPVTLTDATPGGVWSSTNLARATVSVAGLVKGLAAGLDTIKYTITNSCGTAIAIKSITITAGRDNNSDVSGTSEINAADIRIYPNPANGEINIFSTAENNTGIRVMVVDMTGRLLYEGMSTVPTGQLNISTLSWETGNYLFRISEGSNCITRLVTVVH